MCVQVWLFLSPVAVNLEWLPESIYVCGQHRDLNPRTRQVRAVPRSCVTAGMASSLISVLHSSQLCRDFWPGLPFTRTGIHVHVWVFGISAHSSLSSGLLPWIKKNKTHKVLLEELLKLFLLNIELVRPKGDAFSYERRHRKAPGVLLHFWNFPKNFCRGVDFLFHFEWCFFRVFVLEAMV